MQPLYKIDKAIEDCIDLETGEILDVEKLGELQMEREKKITNLACYVKDLEYDVRDYAAEIRTLQKRKKTAENTIKGIRAYLADYLDGHRFHNAKCAISFRKTSHIEIAEDASIPDEFLRHTVTVDKEGLTQAIKDGGVIDGVALVEGQSIVIK